MALFEKKKAPLTGTAVQLRDGGRHPFGVLDGYVPLRNGEIALYRAIREAVPIVDAALIKLIRLVGGVRVQCGDPRAQEGLERFLRTVPTGRGQRGVQSFLDCYMDSLLTCGRAVGELVLDPDGREVAALLCGNAADLEIREGDSPLDFTLCARRENGQIEELPCQELLLFTPFQPETDSPYGVSLLRSMPFLTGILLKIYQATGLVVAGVFRRSDKSGDGALDSRAGFRGLCKKGAELALVLVAVRLDLLVEETYARTAVLLFLIGNEGLSVLENLGLMGAPYPAFLKNALSVLREQGDRGKA